MSGNRLDRIDVRILDVLQQDGRLSNQELAERVGLSPSPCLRRVKRLERDGVIQRYAAVVDQSKVGIPVSVFVSVKLERQREDDMERFEQAIANYREVVECYLMTGSRDYLLRVVTGDLTAYERFLKDTMTRIEGVASIESSFALNQVKFANALPISEL